jgi:hypothetical protein
VRPGSARPGDLGPARHASVMPSRRRAAGRGLIIRGRCGRRMEGTWTNQRPHHRCKLTAADAHLATDGLACPAL